MAKRRYQEPEPVRSGHWWYLLYWQDSFVNGALTRKRKRFKIGPATLPLRVVKKMAAEHLRPMNQQLEPISSATKFEDFVKIYRKDVMPAMVKSTRERYDGILKNYLNPAFGAKSLRDLTLQTVQEYFSSLPTDTLSFESRKKIRNVLSSVLTAAVQYDHLLKNPAKNVRLAPATKGRKIKPYLDPLIFNALLELVPEPYATMIFTSVFTGLRASELIGLKWGNVHRDSIAVVERCCRGDWGQPKSEASNATIPVAAGVLERIHRLKSMTIEIRAGKNATRRYPAVKASGPDDLVFASVVKGAPMRDNNILVRFIKPAARKLGMGWVNWQVLRRSHATWLKLAGADVRDAQAQMRHSRVTTTLEVYQQFVPASQRKAVDRLLDLTTTGPVN